MKSRISDLIYFRDGVSHAVNPTKNGGTLTYGDGIFTLVRRIEKVSDELYKIEDEYTNTSAETVDFVPVLEVNCDYSADFTLIPCVSYDGNRFGNGGDPKGLTCDGEPWVFGYSRTGLPSATISEGMIGEERLCTGLFASSDTESSLISGCSLVVGNDGKISHRILRPEIEAPKTFEYGREYGDAITGVITLDPGCVFTADSYLVECIPDMPKFGVGKVYDNAFTVMDHTSHARHDDDELWRMGISYMRELLVHTDGGDAFVTGLQLRSDGRYYQCGGNHELGWCGQNSTLILALVYDYYKYGKKPSLTLAESVIDTWLKYGTSECGWLASHLPHIAQHPGERHHSSDTVNVGYGGCQLLCAYQLLKKCGIDRRDLLDACRRAGDLLISLFSEKDGIPSRISDVGEAVSFLGSGGMFSGFLLTRLYRVTGDVRYLDATEMILDYYVKRDLNNFSCAAGALDTSCVDKETCTPFLYTALEMYSFTNDKKYLTIAKHAAEYLITWTYMYDVIYEPDADFAVMDFHSMGGTSVSAEHPHIDPWGAVISEDIRRYGLVSGDEKYLTYAEMMWNNTTCAISDGAHPDSRGHLRPYGSQTEAYFHTNWSFYRVEGTFRKGALNDWLVAWPTAHRLAVIMRKTGIFD